MSFARYPAYKDSGVEWLGEVPGHWVVTALKRGFQVTLGKMLQPESTNPDDELLPYLRAANIQWDGVDATEVKTMWISARDRAQLSLKKEICWSAKVAMLAVHAFGTMNLKFAIFKTQSTEFALWQVTRIAIFTTGCR